MATLDIHSLKALSYFSVDAKNTSSIPLFAEYAKIKDVSPKTGGQFHQIYGKRTEQFSKILGIDFLILEKLRDRHSGEVLIDDKKKRDVVAGRHWVAVSVKQPKF